MKTYFSLVIDGIEVDFVSMSTLGNLFQVYLIIDQKRTRFHMQLDESGNYVFALPNECPREVILFQLKISEALKELVNLSLGTRLMQSTCHLSE